MDQLADPALLVAVLLLAAIAGGYGAVLVHVPRVVGFLVAGLAVHHVLLFGASLTQAEQGRAADFAAAVQALRGIKTLALGLIMFSIGGVLESRHMKAVGSWLGRGRIVLYVCRTERCPRTGIGVHK